MTYYLQVRSDGIITDCIEYPYADYVEYHGTITEPIHGGWFKYQNGEIIEVPELRPQEQE